MRIQTRRVYDPPQPTDGVRILVDRLWPRGVPKEAADIDVWLRDVAPSDELRRWYGHDPEKWGEFKERYFRELNARPKAVDQLLGLVSGGMVTFVYAARDRDHNQAVALKQYIENVSQSKASVQAAGG